MPFPSPWFQMETGELILEFHLEITPLDPASDPISEENQSMSSTPRETLLPSFQDTSDKELAWDMNEKLKDSSK